MQHHKYMVTYNIHNNPKNPLILHITISHIWRHIPRSQKCPFWVSVPLPNRKTATTTATASILMSLWDIIKQAWMQSNAALVIMFMWKQSRWDPCWTDIDCQRAFVWMACAKKRLLWIMLPVWFHSQGSREQGGLAVTGSRTVTVSIVMTLFSGCCVQECTDNSHIHDFIVNNHHFSHSGFTLRLTSHCRDFHLGI